MGLQHWTRKVLYYEAFDTQVDFAGTLQSDVPKSGDLESSDIEKLRKEDEFKMNESCRKNLIIESLQKEPVLDSNIQQNEEFLKSMYDPRKDLNRDYETLFIKSPEERISLERQLGQKQQITDKLLDEKEVRSTALQRTHGLFLWKYTKGCKQCIIVNHYWYSGDEKSNVQQPQKKPSMAYKANKTTTLILKQKITQVKATVM